MGIGEPGDRLSLPLKPQSRLPRRTRPDPDRKQLESHLAVQLRIVGGVHHAHTTEPMRSSTT